MLVYFVKVPRASGGFRKVNGMDFGQGKLLKFVFCCWSCAGQQLLVSLLWKLDRRSDLAEERWSSQKQDREGWQLIAEADKFAHLRHRRCDHWNAEAARSADAPLAITSAIAQKRNILSRMRGFSWTVCSANARFVSQKRARRSVESVRNCKNWEETFKDQKWSFRHFRLRFRSSVFGRFWRSSSRLWLG